MRKIKFRGYNRKNNVWLYGFYLQNRGAHFVVPDEFADGKSWDDYEVNPDTLGQFTGLKDKNGQEIYEGDIVDCPRGKFVIGWGKEHKGFEVWQPCRGKLLFLGDLYSDMTVTDDTTEYEPDGCEWEWRVIGNIYDNPELMK